MTSEATIVIAIIAIIALLVFFKILGTSMKWILKLLLHAICGFVVLFIVNVFGGIVGINLELNLINAVVAGALGMPGVVLLLIVKYIL